ncbi:DNA methyltransferase [Porphyrobacter sp. SLTP]|uniref:Eco57I restriction-modification methylase domain-containing protein n=1 Tax=Porphyrobacter sp. SLTP TaxID=2683266 RepID=UPI00336C1DA2
MAQQLKPEHEWLGHVQPTGLVVSTLVLDELSLVPQPQDAVDTAQFAEVLDETGGPLLPDVWALLRDVLKWPEAMVAGLPGTDPIPVELCFSLADHETLLQPTYALKGPRGEGWQLLVRVEDHDIEPDKRGALSGWEATPHQRFERLLRETGVGAGILITNFVRGELEQTELRLITAPRGETSGWISWPLRSLASVAGRPMLGGLKLLLGSFTLFNAPENARLPALLQASRERQAEVSTKLAGQVLAALYELLRGFDAAEGDLVREFASGKPHHLYEGLLTVLMRLVFVLYAEDRDLMPSRRSDGGLELYEQGYSVRGLFARLENDAALNPDTMDERRGAWGQLLALFRLIDRGHPSGFMQARGGKLFDEAVFPFLMGKQSADEPDRVPHVSDGCIHRILQSLMIVNGERLSYRTLDVEQIGSVYETVMGFTAQLAQGRSIAIKAGKNNKTPVYVDCETLLAAAAKEREKTIKETTGRGQLPAGVKRDLKDADTVAAIEAALAQIADERGSPRGHAVSAGTPILQPTDERRRTGSHYTPRSLTEPIVRQALEPAFARLGADTTPDEVLSLKVCDPACGSGAFLVEATRQIGTRLVQAWEAHKALKPLIPADEDDDLHARRLVAQRCIYGVDRNPMATDLAKLSLWLATLARDHEFSFLDHALKSGDSLVGLNKQQLSGGSWDNAPIRNSLIGQTVSDRVEKLAAHRDAIRNAPDDVALAMQESRHAIAEKDAEQVRLIGNAIVAAFFKHDKPRKRFDEVRYVTAMAGASNWWDGLKNIALSLEAGEHSIRPFHWQIEYPEVFSRENPGFDAIVGNPPFLGGKRISTTYGDTFKDWLSSLHPVANQNVDLVGHFFLRGYGLLRNSGAIGFVATNTIGQGATREGSILPIVKAGGELFSVTRRLRWPGEAAVVVSILHISKGGVGVPIKQIDGRHVDRISAFLNEGSTDQSPATLTENAGIAYVGAYLLGKGLAIDNAAAEKGESIPHDEMSAILSRNPLSSLVLKPFIGSDEINSEPQHKPSRYCIDFEGRELGEVREKWPELIEVVEKLVKPLRDKQKRSALRERWWLFAERQTSLFTRLGNIETAIVCGQTAKYTCFTIMPSNIVFSHKTIVFCSEAMGLFAALHSRVHELWCRTFGPTMKDDPVYTPSDCFETFPLPHRYDQEPELEVAAVAYHSHRAAMMIASNKGMTKTYNRFHDPHEKAADIVELRRLHAMMDDAVLRAYGWDDLAARAHPGDRANGIEQGEDAPRFLTGDDEDDHKYQNRLFWPSPFRDELLARLLKLNEERAAAEKAG